MGVKRLSLLAFAFLVLGLFVPASVYAGDLQNQVQGLEQAAEQTQELIDQERLNYLGEEWAGLFLNNKFIQPFHVFFGKINWFFLVMFAKDYSFSLEMLLAFMFWLFTLFSLPGYFFFIGQPSLRSLAALVGTVLLAHLSIFNYLSVVAVKLMFYKPTWYWSLVTFVFIVIVLMFYLYLNRAFGRALKYQKLLNKRKEIENRVTVLEAYRAGLKRADTI